MQVVDGPVAAAAGEAVPGPDGDADEDEDGDEDEDADEDEDEDGEGDGDTDGDDGDAEIWLVHNVVAAARSALALVRAESVWRAVASRRFWAAVIEAVKPEPECDEPEDPVVLPVPVVLVLPLPVPVVLPVPALPVPALPVPVLLGLLLTAPVVPAVPDAAETWPDSACAKVSSALATCPWAVARAYFKEVVSKVARTWPAVTF